MFCSHIRQLFTCFTLGMLLSYCSLACEGGEETDTNNVNEVSGGENSRDIPVAGENTSSAGEEEAVAGEDTSAAGEEEADAGDNTAIAGEENPVAGEEESTAGENEAIAGETVPPAGEESTEAGEEIIIETPDEGGEEWIDPEDFGAPGDGIHAFVMTDINGEEVDMRRYRDRVILVVNVASRCGYTSQYEDLQNLYSEYRERGLVILGFPANNFGSQEPGTDEEIAEFCSATYGVTFPMFSKISVTGATIHPMYDYLTGASGQEVSWNFNKFLVGRDGLFINHYLSNTTPYSATLIQALEAALATE